MSAVVVFGGLGVWCNVVGEMCRRQPPEPSFWRQMKWWVDGPLVVHVMKVATIASFVTTRS